MVTSRKSTESERSRPCISIYKPGDHLHQRSECSTRGLSGQCELESPFLSLSPRSSRECDSHLSRGPLHEIFLDRCSRSQRLTLRFQRERLMRLRATSRTVVECDHRLALSRRRARAKPPGPRCQCDLRVPWSRNLESCRGDLLGICS